MKTVVTIVGARPQFVKMASVSRALRARKSICEVVVHTGQHFDSNMSDIFFRELGLSPPDHFLGVSGGRHGAMTGAMMQKIEPLLTSLSPQMVLVYGDTNSTVAAALVAAKSHVRLAHVEAGLRSFNRAMPEEINRVVTDHLSQLLFSSTDAGTSNLIAEGISASTIHQVGDVMFDSALMFAERARLESRRLVDLKLEPGSFVLATIHRAENTDDPQRLRMIMLSLEHVASEVPVVMPLHPRTRAALDTHGIGIGKVLAIDPVGYLDMIALESQAALVATDSGGVQKEAFFFRVPCVTLRNETEWVELLNLGWNRLAPPEAGNIAATILSTIGTVGKDAKPYGDGRAAELIAEIVAEP